jgi:hypothetical protein
MSQQVITLKGLYLIIERIARANMLVKDFRLGDAWMENSRIDQSPVVLFSTAGSSVVNGKSSPRNEYTFILHCFDQRMNDWSNIMDVMSLSHNVLSDIYHRLIESREIHDLGIRVPIDSSARIKHVLLEGTQGYVGAEIEITVVAPAALCESQLPFGNLNLVAASCTTCSSSPVGEAFDCDALLECPIIQELIAFSGSTLSAIAAIEADVAALAAVSGGTEAFLAHGQVAYGSTDNVITGSTEFTFSSPTLTTPQLRISSLNDLRGLIYTRNTDGDLGQSSKLTFNDVDFILSTPRLALELKSTQIPFCYEENGPLRGSDYFTFDEDNKLLRAESISAVGLSSEHILSGATNLNELFAPISVVTPRIQAGANIVTGGTASLPSVAVASSPSFTNVSASTFVSGSTDLNQVFAPKLTEPIFLNYTGGNQQTNSTSFVTITGTTLHIPSAGLWDIEYTAILSSSNSSNGCDVALSGDMGTSYVCGWTTILTLPADRDGRSWRSFPAFPAATASVLVTSGNTSSIRVKLSATTAGDVWLRVASEAGSPSFITVTDCQAMAHRVA